MRVLVVGPYPPRHCGVGAYAKAHTERLRAAGDEVIVLSPPDGDGDVRVSFEGGRPFFVASRLAPGFGRLLVHFQPSLYYRPRAPVSKVMTSLGLVWLTTRRPDTEILVHEADPPPTLLRPDYLLLRWAFARARLLFHTSAERRALERAYRVRARARIVPHTEGVHVSVISRRAARGHLSLPENELVLLCAGFVHPAKGFDRAVRAFQRAGGRGLLVVVGSVRERIPQNLAYAARLRELCASVPGVRLVERYVSDEEFDTWIAAADWILLPYRRSWSSGALARAQRLGTPAIVAAAGGLPEQAGPRDVVFRDDEELERLLRERAGEHVLTEPART